MKKISLVLTALLFTLSGVAQQSSYMLKMQMRIDGLPPDQAAYGEQDFTFWVKDSKSKTEMSGLMGNIITCSDGKVVTSLSEFFGNKMGYTVTVEDMAKLDKKDEPQPKIEYTNEKKTIVGYECTKVLVKSTEKGGKEQVLIVWVTDKLSAMPGEARKGRRGGFNFGDLKGQPLAFETTSASEGKEITVRMTATEVSTAAIDDSVFIPNTEGYRIMTYSEYKDSMRSMGGGR